MVLEHYAEGQSDRYVCLRSTPNFECSEYEYNKPISGIDSIKTELDEDTNDTDNIKNWTWRTILNVKNTNTTNLFLVLTT